MASTYAFGNEREVQRERLRTLEALFDPWTTDRLEARGVGPGWSCLEVGAGGGSIAAWLCDRVGPDGTVLAIDLDTTVVAEVTRPNLEVRVHDVLEDGLPASAFDLIHLRMVLAWLPRAGTAIERLVAALKPGGWLVAEEMDFTTAAPDPRMGPEDRARLEGIVAAHNAILAQRNAFDPFYGRRVAGDLADSGLAECGCEGRVSMWRGGEAGGRAWALTITQLRDAMVEAALIDAAEVDAALELFGSSRMHAMSPLMMGSWGRRA
ncbi:MAG TPA: methyltransferase domain-containing protein [Solirubrobacteraceae bacterium]|nr:methyltransferase domain-containing protein [Solirubrobacteraceae bacterium]